MKSHPALETLRTEIDAIDKSLIALLAQRFQLTYQVGQYKSLHALDSVDEEREKAQFRRIEALARESNLNPEFAKTFLKCIISEVVKNHDELKKS